MSFPESPIDGVVESTKPFQLGEERRLSWNLSSELNAYLNLRSHILRQQDNTNPERLAREDAFLKAILTPYIIERNRRGDELASSRVKVAEEIAERLYPYDTFGAFCIDGRNYRAAIFGTPPGQGGSIRSLAGDLSNFEQLKTGGLRLKAGSDTAKMLERYFEKNSSEKPMCQVLDSHLGCKARKKIEADELGHRPEEDSGLFADVLRKKELGEGLKRFIRENYPAKSLLPIQFSFNPQTGYGFMGLELDDALEEARKVDGYTEQVLKTLTDQSKIISTKNIAEEFADYFDQYGADINWECDYETSMFNFWQGINFLASRTDVIGRTERKISQIFGDSLPEIELRQRTMLILTNAFNGYLQTKTGNGVYPSGVHIEEIVTVQEQGFGPFELAEFSVYKGVHAADNIIVAASIVRDNRVEKTIIDRSGEYGNLEEIDYVTAPVPVVVSEIIRTNIEEVDWEKLSNLDFSELPSNWHEIPEEHFMSWLNSKWGDLPSVLTKALRDLRRISLDLYTNTSTKRGLAKGRLAPVFAIVDKERRIRKLVPFLYPGVTE